MSMFKKVLLTIGLLLAANVAVLAQTLKGTVTDAKSGDPMPIVNVVVKQNGQQVTGAQTNFDGIYIVNGLQVGTYDIEVSFVGYATHKRTGVQVKASGFTLVDVQLKPEAETLDAVEIVTEKVKIIDIGDASSGSTLSDKDIARMPGQSVDAIVAAVGGVGFSDGGSGTARGEDGMVTMQGSVRKRTGVNAPKEAIASIQVILGGTPASIGESVGGTQIVTLKPPSSQFNGIVKYDVMADYRLYNKLTTYLSGPLYTQHKQNADGSHTDRTLIGFRFTGEGTYYPWGAYRARGYNYQVVNDEKVIELENAPLSYNPVDNTVNYAAEYLRASDFVTIKRPTARNYYASADRAANFRTYNLAAQLALAFRFSEYATLELTGEYTYYKAASAALSPLNMTRMANGVDQTQSFAITADFTQRFPDEQIDANSADAEAKHAKAITNVMWNVSAMYNRVMGLSYNESYGNSINDVLKYGHVGQFFTEKERTYAPKTDYLYNGVEQYANVQNSWRDVLDIDEFIPSQYNPVLANYNIQLRSFTDLKPYLTTFDYIQGYKGLINGGSPSSIYGVFSNVGVQSSGYSESESTYLYGQIKAQATINGKHEIELGFQYDQSNSAAYSLSAYNLWSIMRQQANAHITQLDFDHPIEHMEDGVLTVDYNRLVGDGQTYFDASLRQALGASASDWLDVDRYDPNWYTNAAENMGLNNVLEMFSASDLFNSYNTVVSYYGYDHTGAKYNGKNWSLDDFFDPKSKGHENFQYRPMFSPIYMAGYIQDKFQFQDLIFNVGVRVDYFDGNQYVLKDPYLLYDSYTVGDLRNSNIAINTGNADGSFANAAQDDWVVYVDNDDPNITPTIRGYRSGSTWYDANGVEVSSPSAISGESGKPTPFRTAEGHETATTGNGSGNKVSSKAFEDYTPQIVVMPRIAFSFPIGESAQFKASYDIIARRPSGGWQADYFSYLYMNQISTINNPNLKPERITNYELGFQQALTKKMAVGVTAYYKETRDLIQLVQYAGADPNTNYYSYDNLDFKTTKGFTFSYDLRSTDRIRINANYTLQYAEGTGLSSTTMSELIKEGYTTLKMLNPISDDRRHEFKANVDYRFGMKDGWHYTGTKKNKETGKKEQVERYPLQNLGFNFMAVAQSGRPYTKAFSNRQATIVGSYRGARLPWGFYLDAVADKTWYINIKSKGKPRQTYINAAVNVKNILDIRNVIGVFSVTGSPSDNGYLTDPETQSIIGAYLDPQSFRDLYTIYMSNNTWNYNTPRQIRLTLTYGF